MRFVFFNCFISNVAFKYCDTSNAEYTLLFSPIVDGQFGGNQM